MDVTPFLEPAIAPRAVFDRLATMKDAPRFFVPDAAAQGGYRTVTWGAFAETIRSAALALREMGLAPGDRAAVYAHNSVEWAAAALAIQAAGGCMVPVYPASTAEQATYVLRHCDAKVVFVDAAKRGEIAAVSAAHVVRMDDADAWSAFVTRGARAHAADAHAFDAMMAAVPLESVGLMLYTSGTSGDPKGVPLLHRNITANGRDWLVCNAPLLHEGAVDVLWLPMSHIFGFGEMCLGNTLGFTTYMADPVSAIEKLRQVRPHVFMSVPSHWEKLAILSEGSPERLRELTGGRLTFCLSGGAGLKREVKEAFHAAGMLIIEGYGLTETSPTLTLNRPGDFRFDSVGKPLPTVEVKLADDGEILAKGPNVFAGYHKDPAATKEAFTEDGWFKTGDIGRFTDDGFLQIIDRKKDILVTAGGKNVPPANIEIRFRDDPDIAHVVVYGDAKKFLVAGVWLHDGAAKSYANGARGEVEARVARAIDKVNAQLASYETIKKHVILDRPLTVEDGLLTASFKVRRKHVYARFKDAFEALYTT